MVHQIIKRIKDKNNNKNIIGINNRIIRLDKKVKQFNITRSKIIIKKSICKGHN
jgi:hypothetical protein